MNVVVIRHARAVDRALLQRDRTRVLTVDGRKRMRKAARGLQAILPVIDVVATSPYTRAVQTADIVKAIYDDAASAILPSLLPGGPPRDVLHWLQDQPADACVALVGHEPDLGRLSGYLLTGRPSAVLRFKKGAAALLEFVDAPRAGKASLCWFLTAAQLGKCAKP